MKINRELLIRLLAAVGMLALLSAFLPWEIPLLRLLITLVVACAAWFLPVGEGREEHAHAGPSVSSRQSEDGRSLSHDCAFSHSSVDLTDSDRLPERAQVSVAFGSTTVRLPVDAAVTLHTSCAFGSVSLPGRTGVILGNQTCRLGSQDPRAPQLHVRASCAFGSLTFIMG